MAHPSFNRGQATLINVAALSLISLTVIFGLSSSKEEEASSVEGATSVSASSTLGQITTERSLRQMPRLATGWLMVVITKSSGFHL